MSNKVEPDIADYLAPIARELESQISQYCIHNNLKVEQVLGVAMSLIWRAIESRVKDMNQAIEEILK